MGITKEQMLAIMPYAAGKADTFLPYINRYMAEFGINTPLRIVYFIATIAVESGQLRVTEENLNYSAERLRAIFPKYFPTMALAREYARKPVQIGARVYAKRMGNGSEASGEGYKFRGRGLIQLTGKNNYIAYSKYCGVDLTEKPELLARPLGATRSACWFWKTHGLNEIADRDNARSVRYHVNGGYIGLAAFLLMAKKAKEVLIK